MNNPEKLAKNGTQDKKNKKTTNKQKQKHNTICGGHYSTQTNRNNVDKTFTSPHTNNWR
jgi:hypothetical protein